MIQNVNKTICRSKISSLIQILVWFAGIGENSVTSKCLDISVLTF